jgi:hypothetical protein
MTCIFGAVQKNAVYRKRYNHELYELFNEPDIVVHGSFHVGFVVGKVALGQGFLRVLRFSPVSMIPLWLSILVCHLGDENRSVGGRSSETFTLHTDRGLFMGSIWFQGN